MLDYFHNIAVFDKESDSFRYPYHIKMQKNILNFKEYTVLRVFEKQTHIDLIGEAKKMSAAYEILAKLYDSIINVKPCFISSKFRQCNSTFLNEGGGYYEQSVVGYEYNNRNFYSYCRGYLECANLLKQYLTDKYDKGAYCPYLVYPMFYLYRNNIELQLKSMIFDCSELDIQERCAVVFENKHKILKLFAFIEDKILPFYSISKTDPFIVNSKRYCEILHRFDSDSGRFRYPVNKKCNPYQKNKQYYSFIEIGDFLESLCNAIDGIHSEIEQRAEFLSEMRVENSNYY